MNTKQIIKHLPGFHCGLCNYKTCEDFAEALIKNKTDLDSCKVLKQYRFLPNLKRIKEILEQEDKQNSITDKLPKGLIDGYEADFMLEPIKEINSCIERLAFFGSYKPQVNEVIRYRPLGCPIIHFAQIIEEYYGSYRVKIVGPINKQHNYEKFQDMGIAMILGFEGKVNGKLPKVGQTVRFIPAHCMMQKVHSGVVIQLEGKNIKIDGIDLKVWNLSE
jgi:uncharacterized Fe-S cluster-containing protein